jgi:hypothetical protein
MQLPGGIDTTAAEERAKAAKRAARFGLPLPPATNAAVVPLLDAESADLASDDRRTARAAR